MKLYPPIIKGTIPAFAGNFIYIPFEMNKSVSKTDISGFSLKIKTVQSNSLFTPLNSIHWDIENNIVSFDVSGLNLNIGQFYKVQLAYKHQSGIIGYYSTVGVVKCTAEPIVEIGESSDGLTYTGRYSQEIFDSERNLIGDSTEKVYAYNFSLYDNAGNLVETSGDLLHNSSKDTSIYESIDVYTLKKDLEKNKAYKLKYTIKTINGFQKTAEDKKIMRGIGIDSKLRTVVKCKVNIEDGYVDVSLTKPEEDIVEKPAVGSFYLLRASSEDNFSSWSEVLKFVLYGQQPSRHLWKDMTVKQGVTYKYAVQQYNEEQLRTNRIESNEVYVDFEHAFLFDGDRQLKIKYNPKISSFKNTLLESKTETIGSKYPFIFRNGNVSYKEFPISGLISYLSDENKLFFNSETDIFYDVNLTSQNLYLERQFKLEVLNWLNNGKPKLFRSPSEGNYIVRLMNVSLSPTDSVGRMLHSFNCNAYEIADNIYDNLKLYNFVKVNDPTTPQLRWLSVDLSTVKDSNKNLLKYNASSIRLEGLIPGDKFKIKMNNIDDESIIAIGATGSYSIDLKNDVVITNLCYLQNPNTPVLHQGTLTYSYYSTDFKDSFDTVVDLRVNRIPCYQFVGAYDNILDEINTFKEHIGEISYIRFKLRDAEQVAYKSGNAYYKDKSLSESAVIDLADSIDIFKLYKYNSETKKWEWTWFDAYNEVELGPESNNAHSQIIINGDESNTIDLQDTLYFELKHPQNITSIKTGSAIICEICYQSTIITYIFEKSYRENENGEFISQEESEEDSRLGVAYDAYSKARQALATCNTYDNTHQTLSYSRTQIKTATDNCKNAWKYYCQMVEQVVAEAEKR